MSEQTPQEPQVQPKQVPWLLYGLGAASVLFLVLSIYLWLSLNDKTRSFNELSDLLAQTLVVSQQTQDSLDATSAQLTTLQGEHQTLQAERDQLAVQSAEFAALASLNESQKFVFADGLNWTARQLGYTDPLLAIEAYNATLTEPVAVPNSCIPMSSDRYEHWASPLSTLLVASPGKMGWPTYVGWSIRENVVFGPGEHFDAPGFVGSRGYEIRYPLTGSWPLQELHTTINVYDHEVGHHEGIPDEATQEIALNCNVTGYLRDASATSEDRGMVLYFNIGGFESNIKLKFFDGQTSDGVGYLTRAANLVIDQLTSGL
jgi:hypothetical protein